MTADATTFTTPPDALKAVEEAARSARGTVADLAGVPAERLDQALRAIADGLVRSSAPVLAANEADMTAAREAGLGGGLLDRLRLDEARLEGIAGQLEALAGITGDSYLHPAALAHGFRDAAIMAAVFCAAGGVLAALTIRNPSRSKCEETTPQEFTCSLEAPPLRTLEPTISTEATK